MLLEVNMRALEAREMSMDGRNGPPHGAAIVRNRSYFGSSWTPVLTHQTFYGATIVLLDNLEEAAPRILGNTH